MRDAMNLTLPKVIRVFVCCMIRSSSNTTVSHADNNENGDNSEGPNTDIATTPPLVSLTEDDDVARGTPTEDLVPGGLSLTRTPPPETGTADVSNNGGDRAPRPKRGASFRAMGTGPAPFLQVFDERVCHLSRVRVVQTLFKSTLPASLRSFVRYLR